jgi:hypothetical protein
MPRAKKVFSLATLGMRAIGSSALKSAVCHNLGGDLTPVSVSISKPHKCIFASV